MDPYYYGTNMEHFEVVNYEYFGCTHSYFDGQPQIPRHDAAQTTERHHLLRNNRHYVERKEAEESASDCNSARNAFEKPRAPTWLWEPHPLSLKHSDVYYSDGNRWNWYYKDEHRDVQYTRDIAATQFVYDESTIDISSPWIDASQGEGLFSQLERLHKEDTCSETPLSRMSPSSARHLKPPTKSKRGKSAWFSKAKNLWNNVMDLYAHYLTLHQYKYESMPPPGPNPQRENKYRGRRYNSYKDS
ncbi:hypothetical protein F5B22DRAFT_601394 [Xylaria bambusicola]|uniref:uncharacterized protein n=1 Tax=Xylaria bambusicola TaxID=326684 RepID=UPI0020078E0C|nr:uncharacterized protein F5B22DRAFT_601394 [Xylaria bambusicola]KAI0518014.1 hypothetical protein F5B22DRAFT_601394 [Xylaria bambusicola]